MTNNNLKLISVFLVSLLMLAIISCNNNDGTDPDTDIQPSDSVLSSPSATLEPTEVIIGNLTDQTGVGATAMSVIDMALDDMVNYYNEQKLIPGVKLLIKTYDTQYDPALAKTGYEYLKGKGAILIWSPAPNLIPVIKPIADEERFPVFAASVRQETLMPPGYVFSLGTIPQQDAYTLLKWIAENHWDYTTNNPAKIGGTAWSDGFTDVVLHGMQEYVDVHPQQFQWMGSYLKDFGFDWSSEIELLKNCDYLWPPIPMHVFMREYSRTDYETTFIGSDGSAGFLSMIDKGDLWDEIDGMLFIRASRWWTEEGPVINLTKELLHKNHPAQAEAIMREGVGYLASAQMYQLCNIIKSAAENVGAENLNSQAIYNAAVSYTESIDGIEMYGFNETKRCLTNYYTVYEVNGEKKDLFRAEPDWIPVVTEP